MSILQPYNHLMEKDMTIGWATGLRSCSEPGRSDTRTRTSRGRGWWGPQQHQYPPQLRALRVVLAENIPDNIKRGREKLRTEICPPDLDGGWSGWSAWTAGVADCQVRVRNCDSPVPCGAGLDCKGEAAEYDNCPGKHCEVGYLTELFLQFKLNLFLNW